MKLTDQLVIELERQARDINQVRFGEIVFRVQNGKVVQWDVESRSRRRRPQRLTRKTGGRSLNRLCLPFYFLWGWFCQVRACWMR